MPTRSRIGLVPAHARPDFAWRTDLDQLDPAQVRLGLYALRLLTHQPELQYRLADNDFLISTWTLCLPLLRESALDELKDYIAAATELEENELFSFVDDQLPANVRRMVMGGNRREMELWLVDQLSDLDAGTLGILTPANARQPSDPVVGLIADSLGLDDIEAQIIDFVERLTTQRVLSIFLRETKIEGILQNVTALAHMLGLPQSAVRSALSGHAPLRRLALVACNEGFRADLEDYLSASPILCDLLVEAPQDKEALLDTLVTPAPRSTLCLSDFPHQAEASERLSAAFSSAIEGRIAGVNALLYGAPGTGKSEFASALADAIGARAYCVATSDENDIELDRQRRLSAYLIAQRVLAARKNAILIFDEVEDVFSDGGGPLRALLGIDGAAARGSKGWMNRALEENVVPTVWITNDAQSMDPAYLRRFLLPVAFGAPTREVRRRMAALHLGQTGLPDEAIDAVSADAALTPAQLGSAARLIQLMPQRDPMAELHASLDASARLLHGAPARQRRPVMSFDAAFLNTSGQASAAEVAEALHLAGEGRLLFSGPPGTGKTELAHMLAEALGRELICGFAAAILSRYVGDTEKALAAFFSDHDPATSVLLLDEIDSLLLDRAKASHSWETTQVNELLQQMERYPGIFIAATNHVEGLDPAAMRRFDFKLSFAPLTPQQRLALFARETLGDASAGQTLPAAVRAHLAEMPRLTPGDFAVVVRQFRLLRQAPSPEPFFRRLREEYGWKHSGPQTASPRPSLATLAAAP